MAKIRQIPLDLAYPVSFELADFIVSASNSEAYHFIEAWPELSSHFGAIVGPAGCGKSHLVHAWAREVGAKSLTPLIDVSELVGGQFYFIDDVNQLTPQNSFAFSDEYLFHTYNWTREIGAKLIVTDEKLPTLWRRDLPDLKSRLATVPAAVISEPDDELLKVLLVKLFSDRQLQVDIDVIIYLVARMPRSFLSAVQIADIMDKTALSERRRITKALARGCLSEL